MRDDDDFDDDRPRRQPKSGGGMKTVLIIVGVVLVLLLACGDWPKWRGPNRNDFAADPESVKKLLGVGDCRS